MEPSTRLRWNALDNLKRPETWSLQKQLYSQEGRRSEGLVS